MLICMSKSPGTTEKDYANLTVSAEFRDKVRIAKAEDGLTYEGYLKEHLPIDAEA